MSFSDPVPRLDGDRVVMRGHIGVVYKASNALYVVGRRRARWICSTTGRCSRRARRRRSEHRSEVGPTRRSSSWIAARIDRRPLDPRSWRGYLTGRPRSPRSSVTVGNLKYLFPLGGKAVERHVRAVAKVQKYLKARRDERGVLIELVG